jgi:hypothetical protein
MQYDRFDDLITQKYGVIIKNWPLKQFRNPSAVATRIELEVLFNAWESGVTSFYKLSCEEMRAWENDRFSSRLMMMTSSPPSESAQVASSPTTLSTPPTPNTTTPIPSVPVPPELPPPSPTQPEMVLVTELTEQDTPSSTSDDVGPCTSILPFTTQPPAPDHGLVAEMISLDPTLQSIDPALIMMGLAQGHHRSSATTVASANTTDSPLLVPRTYQNKRTRGAFEIVTPSSFNAHTAKKPRKERKGGRAKTNGFAAGRENILLVEGV